MAESITLRNSGEITRISHACCLTPRRVTIRLDCQKRKVSFVLRWKGSFVSRLHQEPIGRRKLYSHQYPFQRRLDIVKDQYHQLRLRDLPESRSHAAETEYLGAITRTCKLVTTKVLSGPSANNNTGNSCLVRLSIAIHMPALLPIVWNSSSIQWPSHSSNWFANM